MFEGVGSHDDIDFFKKFYISWEFNLLRELPKNGGSFFIQLFCQSE